MINQISCIYSISNLLNNKFYIGSTISFINRKANHLSQLKNNRHFNNHLQNDYNKCGKDNFVFDIVESVENEFFLIKREQWYLDFFNPEYNIYKQAGCHYKITHLEETKKKISEKLKGKPAWNKGLSGTYSTSLKGKKLPHKKLNDEQRKKISGENAHMYGKHLSKETREKIRLGNIGKKHTYESKKKISILAKCRIMSDETKSKISNKLNGRIFSQEHRNKISIKLKEYKSKQINIGQNRKSNKNSSSKYKGVSLRKNGKWLCQIQLNGKKTHIGLFSNENDAAIAYNKKAIQLFGKNATLNIIN